MDQTDIINALNDVDPALVDRAAPKKKRPARRWIAAAACLAALLGLTLGLIRPWQLYTVDLGGVTRLYRGLSYSQDSALIFPWEYRPLYARFGNMTLEGREYRTRTNTVSEGLLGEYLGQCEAFGYDIYTESTYEETFPAYAIAGIDPALLVAVEQGGSYYVFMEEEYAPPATLGGFLDGYDLARTLPLEGFTLYTEGYEGEYRQLTDAEAASTRIWQLLSQCREAEYLEQDRFSDPVRRVTFTATSEELGIYKKVFTVNSDGYVDTNIAEYGYAFYIGEETAAAIIDYVSENSQKAEQEPYQYYLAGTVTEICDGYFLLDDSALSAGKGMTFKVPTDDLEISRWLDFGGIGVGDFISVSYTGGIVDGTVQDPCDLAKAFLADGNVLIPE